MEQKVKICAGLSLTALGILAFYGAQSHISRPAESMSAVLDAGLANPLVKKIPLAEESVKANPEMLEPLIQLGDLYFNVGRYEEAERTFLKALDIDGNNEASLLAIANLYRYRGRYQESEATFLKAISNNPMADRIYVDIGKLYRNWNKFAEAEAAFKKALEINPNNGRLYSYGLGYLYRDMGRNEEAELAFEKAFELAPDDDYNLMGLGDIYREMGRYEESEKYFKMAIAMNSQSESYMGLGQLYMLQEGREEEAKQAFLHYLKFIRPKGEVYNNLAYIYIRQKRYKEAEDMFKKSIEINPHHLGYLGLGILYKEQGRYNEAREMFKKSLEMNPEATQASVELGQL